MQPPEQKERILKSQIKNCLFSATLTLLVIILIQPCVQTRYYEDESTSSSEEAYLKSGFVRRPRPKNGIFPPISNLARHSIITSNATCGLKIPENYCKLVQHTPSASRPSLCDVCDNSDRRKRHAIRYAIDGSSKWWQSPSLANGREFEWTTITIDLGDVYQVAYIIIKAAISPRPGNWILERSLDGINYLPWQYYAMSDDECYSRYGLRAKIGKPTYDFDEEVICTSYFSKLDPLEFGEIHTSLVTGRPGADGEDGPSEELLKFTLAKFIRLRLQKIRTLYGDLMTSYNSGRFYDKNVMRRYFYTISDISIGGHCNCWGHSSKCEGAETGQLSAKCYCENHCCGSNCEQCCPQYNQYKWAPGEKCEKCQCFGHSDSCVYDPVIHEKRLSLNTLGHYDGGGVCLNCKENTTGINCEKCIDGYFRPKGVQPNHTKPCLKCSCSREGSEGSCVGDEDVGKLMNMNPGDCVCKPGFQGAFCDKCAEGYRGFPICTKNPYELAGIINSDCEGECICKENVQGIFCTDCKVGYFNLDIDNPEGCSQCFCHGVTNNCKSSDFLIVNLRNDDIWQISDLHGTKLIPAQITGRGFHISEEEVSNFENYFWTEDKAFVGKKINSYGLKIVFHVSWKEGRGDTSGRPIKDYDLIIQNSKFMLAFKHKIYEGNNATITVKLHEMNCIVLPDVDNNIIQTEINQQETPCTKLNLMESLSDIKRLLLRARFHTNQMESYLHYAYMESADPEQKAVTDEGRATSIEMCSCPEGYEGFSCEKCAFGYRKSSRDSWLNECIKCDCNGHSASCDFEGNCLDCLNNSEGKNCEFCKKGFYRDPKTKNCLMCECPLREDSNNFSPTCEISGNSNSYVCTACPEGYTGPYCERCAKHYFGNPTKLEDNCQPCLCPNSEHINGDLMEGENNVCDHLTGECLVCPQNTAGFYCDICQRGFFGNPLNGSCNACECSTEGSLSLYCHQESGNCLCKENYGGRKCDTCIDMHGSISEGCSLCNCNKIGSASLSCNKMNGNCECKKGVIGRKCDRCLDLHFGFSEEGCSACDCHSDGSQTSFCDLNTGQCPCFPNVIGRECNLCEIGYWNIQSGCEKCVCNPKGSIETTCDAITGQCNCKSGVSGRTCNTCEEGFFNFTEDGCKKCEPCDREGHICDPNSGKCICPKFTEGESCEKCQLWCFGFDAKIGCQECNCSSIGSITPQCSPTGKCSCNPNFDGQHCNTCAKGHYNFPQCKACNCDPAGTIPEYCDENGVCSCNNGNCHCKANVVGQRCDKCKDGTYGLDQHNIEGCHKCFCFQRTNKCHQGYFEWRRLWMLNSQKLEILRSPGWEPSIPFDPYIEGNQHCYIYLSLPTDRSVTPTMTSESRLSMVNNLLVIPDGAEKVVISKGISFASPLYWQLPHIFLGDKVLSYNGFLRFHVISDRISPYFPHSVLNSYPVVQIQGNHRLILEHFPQTISSNGYYEIRLNENFWKLKHGPYNGVVNKEVMMVALQNLQHILIRGTDTPEFFNATMYNVSIDYATPSKNTDLSTHGIEVCECPPQYNSTSCQNPKIGYYRWYKREYITSTVIIDLIGEAKPCECNGRSDVCDTETGHCLNCSLNTRGSKCELCEVGYYGNAFEKCIPCPCPSIWNNHAESCVPGKIQFQCKCLKGYTGISCDRCEYGFYGNPEKPKGFCQSCNCNPTGSVSDECDEVTGQCNCKKGISGRDCSVCSERNIIINNKCSSCDDGCTGQLLDDLDDKADHLASVTLSAEEAAVWKRLNSMENMTNVCERRLTIMIGMDSFISEYPTHLNLAKIIQERAKEVNSNALEVHGDTRGINRKLKELQYILEVTNNEIWNTVGFLQNFSSGKETSNINPDEILNQVTNIVDEMILVNFAGIKAEAMFESDLANLIMDNVYKAVFNSSAAQKYRERTKLIRGKLADLHEIIENSLKNSDEADSIYRNALVVERNSNNILGVIDKAIMDIDKIGIETLSLINEGGYFQKETEQVFLMLEDLNRNIRNTTKDVEMRETNLFEFVPMYRTKYAQIAFTHVDILKEKARNIENIFRFLQRNISDSLNAVTAYDRIKEAYDDAYDLALNASKICVETHNKLNVVLQEFSVTEIMKKSEELINKGLILSGKSENGIRNDLNALQDQISLIVWKIKRANDSVQEILFNLKIEDENILELEEFNRRVMESFESSNEASMEIMELETKIIEMKAKIDSINGGVSPSAYEIKNQVADTLDKFGDAEGQADVVDGNQYELDKKMNNLEDEFKQLRALIKKSRHKTDSVKVSIGPDSSGICFRLYQWPTVDDSTIIKFNFAPTRKSDSLLFYWPSSINDDYISIEMINDQIRASWDLGSGLRSLIHPKKLKDLSEFSNDPDFWYEISVERIGSSVKLIVQSKGELDPSKEIEYMNSPEEATLMNLSPEDQINIGGFSSEKRVGLVSNGLSGCIHNLRVNHKTVGLWNFVGNEGCTPCMQCQDDSLPTAVDFLEYYYDGRGYSAMNRMKVKTFNPRFFDVSMELRTFSENGLLFLTVNEENGQIVSLQIVEGSVVFLVRHLWNDEENEIKILSDPQEKINTGEWIEIRAVWFFQRQKQIGQLSVGKKNFKQEKRSSITLSLNLYDATYQIGGNLPGFDTEKWDDLIEFIPYIGCIKNLLIDSTGYDPLSGSYFGVETPCGGKEVYLMSLEGNGFAEFSSKKIDNDLTLAFSFKTLNPSGLLLLSAFAKSPNPQDESFYGVYLENGLLRVVIYSAASSTLFDLNANSSRYDNGRFHAVRIVFKKNKKAILFINDEERDEKRFPKNFIGVDAPETNGGLFIGGLNEKIKEKFANSPIKIIKGFSGCIRNLYFDNSLLNFYYPLSFKNQILDICPNKHDFSSSRYHSSVQIPDSANFHTESPSFNYLNWYETLTRNSPGDLSCYAVQQKKVIVRDESQLGHFGDISTSHAIVSLDGSRILKQKFNITFYFRTFYPNGLFFQGIKKGNEYANHQQCLSSYLKDGKILVKLHGQGARGQELTNSVTLNDGEWHQITIIKADEKMYLHVDFVNTTATIVPKLKPLSKMYIGGIPSDGHDCFENSIQKPEYFKGCFKNLVVNSHSINLDNNPSVALHKVNPCFKDVERGTFFHSESYAIYSHNITFGSLLEMELEFRSDSRDGILLSFIPGNNSDGYPTFSIFLENGNVVARETLSRNESYQAVQDFSFDSEGYVCNGLWHTIRAYSEKGSISLRVDNLDPIFGLDEPLRRGLTYATQQVTGSLYVGGYQNEASHQEKKKNQFHGCIRNISINRERKDWTDMTLSNVFLNACPV